MRVPIRARITAAFGAVMVVLLIAISALAYRSMSGALLDEIDTGLRFRAAAEMAPDSTNSVEPINTQLQEPNEAFQQVLTQGGRVVWATAGFRRPVLRTDEIARVRAPTLFQRSVPTVVGPARLLAVPLDDSAAPDVLVVGATMTDRTDALRQLTVVLLIGGPVAVLLACAAGWVVAGWALRPMDRLRAQASAITLSGLDRRLDVPRTRDEVQRLARTLNDVLDRLAHSMAGERAFLERAGHELRTPLAALRAEIDLALRRERTAGELSAALRSASAETDRLARLAEDLLVLARAGDGRLPIHREPVRVRELLESSAALFAAQAEAERVQITVQGDDARVELDPVRMRQVLTNLLANALRHTPPGGAVTMTASVATDVLVTVSDTGPGFNPSAANDAGLGLRIVSAIVEAHGGQVDLGRTDAGGAAVRLVLPRRN